MRDDLRRAHQAILEHVASPGTWLTGAERVAVAQVSRAAPGCALCRERKAALSPYAVGGEHDAAPGLDPLVVEVAHRVRTDSGRLSRAWFEALRDAGLDDARYVEVVGVVTMVAGLDYCARALGLDPFPLPRPRPGEPSRRRPASAKPAGAWLPTIAPEEADGPEADLYGGVAFVPNIMRALSLVPDQVRMLIMESDSHYVPIGRLTDPTARRALDRAGMELVAARVSALNECFY